MQKQTLDYDLGTASDALSAVVKLDPKTLLPIEDWE